MPAERLKTRVNLVDVLTPEFHSLNPEDFANIPDGIVERASPQNLRASLLDLNETRESPLRHGRGVATVSYQTPESGLKTVRLSITPVEYGLFPRNVNALARVAINQTLASKDSKKQQQTGDPSARARSDEDRRAANRAAVRQLMAKKPLLDEYLDDQLLPRIEIVDKFKEMTRYKNLNRGNKPTVGANFEYLRSFVFGDMLDAISNLKSWDERQTNRAVSVLQKRLYIAGSPNDRVANFRGMLDLAEEYYGHKRAFVLTRMHEIDQYLSDNQAVVDDVLAIDKERAGDPE